MLFQSEMLLAVLVHIVFRTLVLNPQQWTLHCVRHATQLPRGRLPETHGLTVMQLGVAVFVLHIQGFCSYSYTVV